MLYSIWPLTCLDCQDTLGKHLSHREDSWASATMPGTWQMLNQHCVEGQLIEESMRQLNKHLNNFWQKNIYFLLCPHRDLRGKSAFPKPQLLSSLLPEHRRGLRVQINGEAIPSTCKTCLISVPKEKASIPLPARHPPQCAADAKHTHMVIFPFSGSWHQECLLLLCQALHLLPSVGHHGQELVLSHCTSLQRSHNITPTCKAKTRMESHAHREVGMGLPTPEIGSKFVSQYAFRNIVS